MTTISLAGVASYLPETIITNEFFAAARNGDDKKSRSPMYHAPTARRHVAHDETAAEMIVRASTRLIDNLNLEPADDIDVILTNVSLPDQLFTGCGAEVAHRLGAKPQWVLDLHNTGCVSFIYMIEYARMLMESRGARSALVCNVQSAAGRVFAQPENRARPQSAIPGDACGVAYLVLSDESPVIAVSQRCFAEFAGDMSAQSNDGRRYWEPGASALNINFNEARIAKIMVRGNELVPRMVHEACAQAGVTSKQIDVLITNQPNPIFLRNWREALGVPKEAHPDTFDKYGNLFGAGIPVTLDEVISSGALEPNDLLVLGGFAHAGDYAAAAVIRWQARN